MKRDVNRRSTNGYTLVEAITVLVVIGVLSVAMMIRTEGATQRSVEDQADLLRRDLTHIQSLNLAYGIPLRLNVSTATFTVTCIDGISPCYKVTCIVVKNPCTTIGETLLDPTSQLPFERKMNYGVTVRLDNSLSVTADTTDFDSLGRPSAGVTTNPVRTFSVMSAARTSYVDLRPITGFAEVRY